MFGDKGHHSILTAPTSSAGWKSIRKGVMPAFSPQNIRCVPDPVTGLARACVCWSMFSAVQIERQMHVTCVDICKKSFIASLASACSAYHPGSVQAVLAGIPVAVPRDTSADTGVCYLSTQCCMCRHGFRHVVDINQRLVGMLTQSGTEKAVDMDELLKREALDVIGQHFMNFLFGKQISHRDSAQLVILGLLVCSLK